MEIYKELDRMLELDVIEESQSSWCSPIALVRKANGKARLCLDARKLNDVTKKVAYPIPLIDGLISRLDQTRYISSLDLKDAFWQIPLHEGSREKTAFAVPGRPLYQFKVMPFGLCNAPQTMSMLMHKVIPYHLHDRVSVYLDDLLLTSATFEEHISLLKDIADRLKAANLTINIEKSKFCLKKIKYLGYVVGDKGLQVDAEKVQSITFFPIPKTVRHIRRFLGVTGWYRRFIANYSTVSAPLTELLKKKRKFAWTPAAQEAFDMLKLALVSAPVLATPDFTRRFYLQCDASTTGVGSVLFQRSDDGGEHPIAYFSQKLNGAQRNYSITELECLAAVLSVKKFRAYIEGLPFTIITDHASLKWLMSQRDLSGRLARWSLKLQGFDFGIEHRKGTLNTVPDALSRLHADELLIDPDMYAGSDDVDIPPLHVDLESPAFAEEDYVTRIKSLQNHPEVETNLRSASGKLFINMSSGLNYSDTDISSWKLVIPDGLTKPLIIEAHNSPTSSHTGVAKTLDRLRRHFFWSSMAKDVKEYIANCDTCKSCKATNSTTRPPMGEFVPVSRPFQKLYIDFLGPYPRSKQGNTQIIIVLDKYSRFVIIKPIRQATAQTLVTFLEKEVFHLFGVPESILTDNGKQFESHVMSNLLKKYGVDHVFTPKYSPQANASERVNRSILSAVRAYIRDSHQNWDRHLNEVASALRNVVHGSTGFSPYFLVFGHHMVSHGSVFKLLRELSQFDSNHLAVDCSADRLSLAQEMVLERLKEAYKQNASRYNLRSRDRKLVPGQIVHVRNFTQSDAVQKYSAKLAPKFVQGKIVKNVGTVAYEVTDLKGNRMGVYHLKDIKT